MSDQLTPWFPESVKPARAGWYETKLDDSHLNLIARRRWTGRSWSAASDGQSRSAIQQWLWRGLANPPKEQA